MGTVTSAAPGLDHQGGLGVLGDGGHGLLGQDHGDLVGGAVHVGIDDDALGVVLLGALHDGGHILGAYLHLGLAAFVHGDRGLGGDGGAPSVAGASSALAGEGLIGRVDLALGGGGVLQDRDGLDEVLVLLQLGVLGLLAEGGHLPGELALVAQLGDHAGGAPGGVVRVEVRAVAVAGELPAHDLAVNHPVFGSAHAGEGGVILVVAVAGGVHPAGPIVVVELAQLRVLSVVLG